MSTLALIDLPQEVIARARRGEDAAREQIYRFLAPGVFGLIRRLVGGRAVAEDLFQDTMMTAYEQLGGYRGEAPLGAWVRRIAVSKCLMHLRSPWQRVRLGFSADAEEGGSAGEWLPTVAPPRPETLDLERALATLSPTARAVVWLFEVEGWSHEEIAAAFGRSSSFSKSQLARAHRRLRAFFEPDEQHTCAPT
ncbi:MAG TPA: RNA polymerase sigma factor [Steroidobacteraceae bacterium]|nr:RNA polymerase sigma factor [Steroidobacteraceae bacterium]